MFFLTLKIDSQVASFTVSHSSQLKDCVYQLRPPHTDGPVHVCFGRVAEKEPVNKMSLHNLATVFGPTLLRPSETESSKGQHITSASDIWSHDVMAQVAAKHICRIHLFLCA